MVEETESNPILRGLRGNPPPVEATGSVAPEVTAGVPPEQAEASKGGETEEDKKEKASEQKRKRKTKEKPPKRKKESKKVKKEEDREEEECKDPEPVSRRDFPLTAREAERIRKEKSEDYPKKKDAESEDSEEIQRKIDRKVSERPKDFGLDRVGVRGTAGRHFEEGVEYRVRNPAVPEPVDPPSWRSGSRRHDDERRERSPVRKEEKPPKWRGFKHYNRGVDYWQRVRRQKKK